MNVNNPQPPLRLRVKDVDLERGILIVRAGKGDEDRPTVLPVRLQDKPRAHRERLRRLHVDDRAKGLPGVWLPEALERKYPSAGTHWNWQWVFASQSVSVDPRGRTGAESPSPHPGPLPSLPGSGEGEIRRRHHLDPGTVDQALRVAVAKAALGKRVTSHTFRQHAECRIMPSSA